MFTDQTGIPPQQSSRGNNYQMVLYDIESSSMWVKPMKNRTEGEMVLDRRRALNRTRLQNIVPTHQVLDNEISAAYLQGWRKLQGCCHLHGWCPLQGLSNPDVQPEWRQRPSLNTRYKPLLMTL